MAQASNDLPRLVCANTVKQNEKKLLEARIKSQGKDRTGQDLNKLFHKLNQGIDAVPLSSDEKLSLSCYNKNVATYSYGPVPGFAPGSWWGIRMDCSRDRVHTPFNIDIHEGPFGVISVCTSHTNMKEDIDLGDFLTLTGQTYHKEQSNADPFIWNYKNQIPLRLIRSYNLQNTIAPNTGYRYDGLYVVIGCWIGADTDGTKHNKVALMRLTDQEPPIWSNTNLQENGSSYIQHSIPSAKSSYSKLCISNAYQLRKNSYNIDGTCEKRKYSCKDNHKSPLVAKTIPLTNKKSVPKSFIVTRHVSKKTNNMETMIPSTTSVPDRKTLLCLGTSASKTHNTNISIRMGLYDSSHNMQDIKKGFSTMLHKPFKPIDIANRTALDIEDARLFLKKDNKFIRKTNVDKAHINSRSIKRASYKGRINNEGELSCSLNKRIKNTCPEILYTAEHSYTVSTPISKLHDNVNSIKFKTQSQDIMPSSNIPMQKLNPDKQLTHNLITMHEKISDHHATSDITNELFCSQNIKSIKSLDSLTPDKILNLINMKKHHPFSKLLIGNVIGLTNEECAMLNTSKVTTSDSENKAHMSLKINYKKRDNIKENVACLSDDILNKRYYKYSNSKRLSWKMKQTDAGTFDKMFMDCHTRSNAGLGSIANRNNEYVSSLHDRKTAFQTVTQDTHSTYNIKTRLRADRDASLTKQEFSNSPIKRNRYKKQGREIANLSIDAIIGPKTRGPRNRRLRCINNTYTNKRYNNFDTALHSSNKRKRITEKRRYTANFKQASQSAKVNFQRGGSRQCKNKYIISNSLHRKNSNNSINEENNTNNSNNNCKYN